MKGQYFSFDAIIAAVIFIMALVALLSYWHSVKSYLDYQNDPLSTEAVRISNLLFTPPSPSPDCTKMSRLGFALGWDDRRIDSSIVGCAALRTSLPSGSSWLKQELGTPYEVSITVTDLSDNPRAPVMIGAAVPKDTQELVKMRRLATIVNQTDGSTYIAAFDLSLYGPQTG